MTHQDLDAFFARLAVLTELFDAKFSEAKSEIYFRALEDLPLEDVIAALTAAARVCTFMPKPAELRKLAVGDTDDLAEQAWLAMRSAMRRVGAYTSLATTDPALGESLIAIFGGWPQACLADLSPEMWSSTRKAFGRVYRVLRDRGLTGSRYLPGLCEQANAGQPTWRKYVAVVVLGVTGEIRELRGDQADAYRGAIAATSGRELRQVTAGESVAARRA